MSYACTHRRIHTRIRTHARMHAHTQCSLQGLHNVVVYNNCSHTVGHGNSDGDRIHIDDYQTYVADVIQHVELLKSKHPNLPLFIFGESMVSSTINTFLHFFEYVK